ncbi:hypothetical protein [Clostridium transplantifaecale]|uniref:hypothetical protein n=1 Tax=Clostridium transplantifaecale TaxID=2479838 RepID=UPI000F643697|nr:hypothetical protein [Clostridium transplantifaecale]
MKNRINIGTASIILIFIILCLAVFSLLSLSDGKSALVLSERHADSVAAYYQADTQGQLFIQTAAITLKEDGAAAADALEKAAGTLPEGSESGIDESGRLYCEIPMNAGQALRVELSVEDAAVLASYVYNKEDYAIDDSLPVWIAPEE